MKTTPHRRKATLHFPGGLKDYLEASIEGYARVTDDIFAGKVTKPGGHGTVEWAIAWFGGRDGFVNSYCNTVPTIEGGTHETGVRAALSRGLKAYGELAGNKRAQIVTADDAMISAGIMLSVFIREPEFQGQTKGEAGHHRGNADRRKRAARSFRPLADRPSAPGGQAA